MPSASSDMPPQQPGGRTVNLPRLPHIQTQPQNPEMGRASEAAYCKACGTIANTNVEYECGGFACRWAVWMFLAGGLLWWTSFLCCCGKPRWIKVHYWDPMHFCSNCGRKLGYNVQRYKCCGITSNKAMLMPSD